MSLRSKPPAIFDRFGFSCSQNAALRHVGGLRAEASQAYFLSLRSKPPLLFFTAVDLPAPVTVGSGSTALVANLANLSLSLH